MRQIFQLDPRLNCLLVISNRLFILAQIVEKMSEPARRTIKHPHIDGSTFPNAHEHVPTPLRASTIAALIAELSEPLETNRRCCESEEKRVAPVPRGLRDAQRFGMQSLTRSVSISRS